MSVLPPIIITIMPPTILTIPTMPATTTANSHICYHRDDGDRRHQMLAIWPNGVIMITMTQPS